MPLSQPARGRHFEGRRVVAFMLLTLLPAWSAYGQTTQPASPRVDDARRAAAQIDRFVLDHAKEEGVQPQPVIDEATFLRRATMDLVGRIPTAREYREYWDMPEHNRREQLVEKLIKDPRFVDRWSVFFGDLLRVRADADGGDALAGYVYAALRENKPYDEMAREMIVATGAIGQTPEAGFIIAEEADPFELAGVVTQTFMGVRMKCAQCHDHPFDIWTRKEFYSVAAYFGNTSMYQREDRGVRVTFRRDNSVMWPPRDRVNDQSRPLSPTWPFVDETISAEHLEAALERRKMIEETRLIEIDDKLFSAEGVTDSLDGLTNGLEEARQEMIAKVGTYSPAKTRKVLADKIVSPENPYFAWNITNRIWATLVGKGIVNPVDDFKLDNPPSNPELLDYLAATLIAGDYDIRQFIRTVVLSDTYQRSRLTNVPLATRLKAEGLFVASGLRPVPAETLYDSLVIAGHLDKPKYNEGENLKPRRETIRTYIGDKRMGEEMKMMTQGEGEGDAEQAQPAADQAFLAMQAAPANVEGGITVDELTMDDPLMGDRVVKIGMQELIPAAERQQMRERIEEQREERGDYEYTTVTRYYDNMPLFGSAHRMRAPAPSEHFLRQFGQPARRLLGEKRDINPSMRQALILLNGRLSNEAARVGTLEPIYRLLTFSKDVDAAIEMAYLEAFTRKPTDQERADARAVVESAEDKFAGMADLRWALLNSHEFRYMP